MVFGLNPDTVRCVLNVMCGFYNGINICHINAGSLRPKHTILYQMLSTSKVDVVMVSESWLNSDIPSQLVSIPGFTLHRNDRKNRIGGGVCMYIRENLSTKSVYSSSLSDVEFLGIEVKSGSDKCLLVTVYCPPHKFKEEYLKELEDTLTRLSPNYSNILIGGDFNVNYLEKNSTTHLFQYFCDRMNLSVVNKRWPTCFKSTVNPSLIDMFLTSSMNRVIGNDQVRLTSDFIHDLLFCSLKFNMSGTNSAKTLKYRSFRHFDLPHLQQNIGNFGLNNIYNAVGIDLKVSLLTTLTNELYETYVPEITRVLKPQSCPWFTNQLKLLIQERERFFRRFKRMPSEYNRCQYIFARNRVTAMVRSSKRSYFLKRLNPKLNSKVLWNNLKDVGVVDNDRPRCTFSPTEMGSVLVPTSSDAAAFDLSCPSATECFAFRCVNIPDVELAIRAVKSNAIGPDNISPKFVKLILPVLLPYLVHIFNYCIYSSQFPEMWKCAKIIPIPKKSNPKNPAEFRPISLLPFLSKVFEKILAQQIQEDLDRRNKISKWQSGFRRRHSCESAVIKVTTDLRAALDLDEISVMVLLDFSKAFDSINHSLLLHKLKNNFQFSSSALELIFHYLSNRLQTVQTEQGSSSPYLVNTGVPQGSVLGPLLFSVFVNDLPDILVNCHVHLYADDVIIYLSKRLGLTDDCVARINEDLSHIQIWAALNKLYLNPLKSVGMVCARSEVCLLDVPPLVVNGVTIPYVEHVKYLGFKLNRKLSCCDATSDTIRKIYCGLRSLRASSSFLHPKMKLHLVKSLILPFFSYNCIVYPCLDYECKRKINVAFNDCIRYIFNIPRYVSVSQHKRSLLGMSLDEYYDFKSILKLHNIIHKKCPEYLLEYLRFAQSPRGLRLIFPRFTHTVGERSYFVSAIRLWNNLPHQLQRIESSAVFRGRLFLYMSQ